MTKKDYILIAEVLRRATYQAKGNLTEECTVESVTSDMCDALEAENSKFDREKFWEAVEVK